IHDRSPEIGGPPTLGIVASGRIGQSQKPPRSRLSICFRNLGLCLMISGELINLRAIDRSDLELVHDWLDDPELMRFWGYGAPAVSRNHVMQRIEQWLAEEDALGHPVAFL